MQPVCYDSALLGGYHLAFGIGAGLVVASIAVAATVVRRTSLFTPAARGLQKPSSAQRVNIQSPEGEIHSVQWRA